MFTYNTIDEYQIEITSYCNAACPQCPRNINGVGINPSMPLVHLDRDVINFTFTEDLCKRLRQVFFCGSYGDPIMHPKFLDILRDFRSKNPTLWLYFHTNGGVHDTDYWHEVAKILGGYGQIDFGIDGLEDTLHLYRKNVKYDRAIKNAVAFIQAGGRAQWNFIVFKHNEHQVETVKRLGQELGFFNVLIRNTGRFFNHQEINEFSQWPVVNKNGKVDYYLEPPNNPQYQNASIKRLPEIRKQYQNLRDYFSTTEIRCDALEGKKVAINAEGLVLPCNFFNHNLYDHRFVDRTTLPCSNDLSFVNGQNQVRSFLEQFDMDKLNINHCSLKDIFNNGMWNALMNSWNCSLDNGRLFECAMTCGNKLTKVWDQGGSKR